jgi:hypothetical protein
VQERGRDDCQGGTSTTLLSRSGVVVQSQRVTQHPDPTKSPESGMYCCCTVCPVAHSCVSLVALCDVTLSRPWYLCMGEGPP